MKEPNITPVTIAETNPARRFTAGLSHRATSAKPTPPIESSYHYKPDADTGNTILAEIDKEIHIVAKLSRVSFKVE